MKVLIIGIDGGCWNILRPAINTGYMPYLKALIESGASGILMSTKPATTPAAWGSFQTGVNPGKTGVFDFKIVDKRRKKFGLVSSKVLQGTIWEVASENRKNVAIVNVPLTYPPPSVNGYVISGIFTPSMKKDFTYPAWLKHELLEAIPNYHIFSPEEIEEKQLYRKPEVFIVHMAESVKMRAKAAQYLINKNSPDLFMVHFQASDFIQHALWGYMDVNNLLYSESIRDYIFKNFYRLLDEKIYEIEQTFVNKTNDDYLILIISDHGFQAHQRRFNLGNWLNQEGYLTVDEGFFGKPKPIKWLDNMDIFKLRKLFLTESQRSKAEVWVKYQRGHRTYFNWKKTRAFSVGRSSEGLIFLLEENKPKRKLIELELREKLKSIKDPEFDTYIVKEIFSKEQIYTGEYMGFMPDLVIEPIEGYTFTGNFETGKELFHTVNIKDDFHIGVHHQEGILLAKGPVVQQRSDVKAHIFDLVPTILYCLGIPIWEGFDGRILNEIFLDVFLTKHPVKKSKKIKTKPKQILKDVYSEEDADKVKRRLEKLGYL